MSNAREAGTVIGGLVAAYFTGGTSYAAFATFAGATAGGAIGGLIDGKTYLQGPRLDDLKVQYSAYGGGIPFIFGTERISPNVIWSTNKIEQSATTSTGKGGGGTENTSFRYYVHMRLLLCETLSGGSSGSDVSIVQIFQDGKLIYDARSGIPIASALASAENPYAFFTLYQGHEDQLPDAVEELYEGGPGSVPAYRGVVSISMKGIECPGGRVPQFSFVLSASNTLEDVIYNGETSTIPTAQRITASRLVSDGSSSMFFAEYADGEGDDKTKRVRVYLVGLDGSILIKEFSFNFEYWGVFTSLDGDADIDAICFREVHAVSHLDSGNNVVVNADGEVIKSFELGDVKAYGGEDSFWSKRGSNFLIGGNSSQGSDEVCLYDWESANLIGVAEIPDKIKGVLSTSIAWILVDGAPRYIEARQLDGSLTLIDSANLPAEIDAFDVRMTFDVGDKIALWASNAFTTNLRVYTVSLEGSSIVFTVRNETLEIVGTIPPAIEQTIGVLKDSAYGWERFDGGVTESFRAFMVAFDRVDLAPVLVSEVIADLCERAGETRYDVSGIPDTDTVIGYKIGSPASARANIDPLLTMAQIFIVDEDELIRYKKYSDITSVATITFDELGQAEDGSEPSDPMPLNRSQEIDMPKSVSVSYIEPLNDYQVATETEIRQVTEATEDMLVQLPMAITSDQAKTAAQQILFSRWRSQNMRSLKVSRKYAFLSPGDGITVEYPSGTFRLWRITGMTDTGAVVELTAEPGDASLYTQTAVGATGYVGQQVAALAPPTRQQLLDIPILRDADNNAGIYDAFNAGVSTDWRGATLYVGDDDSSLAERGSVFARAPMGVAETVLGDWTTYSMDESNTMIVNAKADSFSSVTRDALIASSTLNAAAFGNPGRWEILQFASASYLGSDQWLISRFLRGLRGTEHNRGNHQSGDSLVLLVPAGMLRPNMDVGSLNQVKQYRAVSIGRSILSAASQSYANTGEGLRPFSPVNLRGDYDGDDIVFSWDRRTRLSNNWLAEIMPLGEASESWEIRLYTDNTFATVLRTFASTTSTVTYTLAQQTADGFTPGDPLYPGVAQISDSVGRGHELEATL